MSGLSCFSLLLCSLALMSPPAASSVYPIINPQGLMASRTPISTVVLPPLAYSRSPAIVYPVVSRRQTEFPLDISQEKEPTCDELKKMWRKMRRIARQMEITNEIPRMQDPFISSAYNYKSKYPDPNPYSHARSSSIKVFQGSNDKAISNLNDYQKALPPSHNYGAVIRDPDQHRYYKVQNKLSGPSSSGRPKNAVHLGFEEFDDDYSKSGIRRNPSRVMGRFANQPLPEEALGVYGTVVLTPEERAKFRSRSRVRPETGFGPRMNGMVRGPIGRVPFRANERHSPYHFGNVVTHMPAERSGNTANNRYLGSPMYSGHSLGDYGEFPTEIGQRSPSSATRVERIDKIEAARKSRNSCLRVHTKVCKNDVDCFCIGSPKLFCGGNRCRPKFKAHKYDRTPKWGKSLYVEPYDYNLVEYGYKKDPLWPSPF